MYKVGLFFIVFWMSILNVFGQFQVTGLVVEESSQKPIVGALAYLSQDNLNTETNASGEFLIGGVKPGDYMLSISYLGYTSISKSIRVDGDLNIGNISMSSVEFGLKEVQIISSAAIDRKTPIAVSTVGQKEISASQGTQDVVELINNTPSVYATKGSGGYGDSRINIRGFNQSNIAVLINGIPVNDMENGWVFWSNFAGLGDAVRSIQVQRGLGASKLAISSVGGTMNILTKTADAQKGVSLTQEYSSFNTSKTSIGLNSGLLKNDWAFSFVGSRTQGGGYVDGTYIDAWSYYLSAYKTFNTKHSLQLTLFGSPQTHGQRDNSIFGAQSFVENEAMGSEHNKNWGDLNGDFKSNRTNFYHKPQLALNHYWTQSEKSFIATSLYVSSGVGGGVIHQGQSNNQEANFQNTLNLTPDNQLDWDQAYAVNDTSSTGSYAILRASRHNHFWTGLLSTLKYDLNSNLKLSTGVDFRHFIGEHYEEVDDLLGGSHWYDFINNNAQEGDRINYDLLAKVTYGGLFGQLEYQNDKFSSFLSAAVSNTWYGRQERFYVDFGDVIGERQSILGYNLKLGGSYKINESNTFYANTGYYSRAPLHSFVFINFSNQVNPNILNEKVMGLELGYTYKNNKNFVANVNAYSTTWLDKWVNNEVSYQPAGTTDPESIIRSRANFNIPKQLHVGLELDFKYMINKNWAINGFGSVGNWEYKGNTDVEIRAPFSSVVLDTMDLYIDGLKVANQPQTSFGMGVNYTNSNFDFATNYRFYDQLFAQFNEAASSDPNEVNQSYKLPAYGLLEARLSYKFNVRNVNMKAYIQGYNLMDVSTPIEGFDGANTVSANTNVHSKEAFKGFWTRGRNFNFGLKVNF